MLNAGFWNGKRVFLTGHTGFKGGWTVRWLRKMGAQIAGYSLPPDTQPNLFTLAGVESCCISSNFGDIRDAAQLKKAILDFEPDIVLHYAAQPLVGLSYTDPVGTFETNVMGALNLLEAVRGLPRETICIMLTSDKCYENPNDGNPLDEHAPFGGADPYSASKGACEVAISSWMRSFFSEDDSPVVATVRAGNVIGGGDWADKRLLPDAIRAFTRGEPLIVRNPTATRPWQHVLEPISGYLLLTQRLAGDRSIPLNFNFGPAPAQVIPVGQVADITVAHWGEGAVWKLAEVHQTWEEAHELVLDVTRAADVLGWTPRLTTREAIHWTVDWWRTYLANPAALPTTCDAQIDAYADVG